MSTRRGYTLIEVMVAVAVLGIGMSVFTNYFQQYQEASRRASVTEGLARVLDTELERARACSDRACLDAWAQGDTSPAAASWAPGAKLSRAVRPGPGGTLEVDLTAEAEHVPPQTISGLIWVKR